MEATPNNQILVLFGTRPEAIKLAPVIHELKKKKIPTTVVCSGQHTSLLAPFLQTLDIFPDYNLEVMTADQTPNGVLSKTLAQLDKVLDRVAPQVIIVQGDTTTTLAGALAGFHRKIIVGHVEAGLRSGNRHSPFPEEMNRRLISQLASLHFCATPNNLRNLEKENVSADKLFLTGNTVVDSLHEILTKLEPSLEMQNVLQKTANLKRILLTTHRRESFGSKMNRNLLDLKSFIENHSDSCLIFPVHPNPSVRRATEATLSQNDRILLLEPLDYIDFIALMKSAWIVVSDSGGVQEEAPSLGVPLLVLRENTERQEAIEAGTARLVGQNSLAKMLEEIYSDTTWIENIKEIENPFGDGKSAEKIVKIIEQLTPKNEFDTF